MALASLARVVRLTASVLAAQAARPPGAQGATGPSHVAYVFDFGDGVNDTHRPNPSPPGSSIFTNAVTGSAPGSGGTATYNITTAGAMSTTTPCTATISSLLITASTLCPNVTVTLAPGTSTGTSTVQNVTIGIPGLPVIKATAIKSLSRTTCAASSGSVTIANLTVGGVAVNTSGGPHTGISLGGAAKLILNEQTPVPGADKGLTVNALHVEVLDGTVDVVVASATSDAHDCS